MRVFHARSRAPAGLAHLQASANGLSQGCMGIKNADERQSVSEEEIKYMVTDNDELLPTTRSA